MQDVNTWLNSHTSHLPPAFEKTLVREMSDHLISTQRQWTNRLQDHERQATWRKEQLTPSAHHINWVHSIQQGDVLEKGGINVSWVQGHGLPKAASERNPQLAAAPFLALGISTVIHPRNPFVPTAHANFRLFMAMPEHGPTLWWFGGGFDMTPYYGFQADCITWHEHARAACEVLGPNSYHEYKAWCDRYFYLKHRQEPRGIGGLFFDDLNHVEPTQALAFVKAASQAYIDAYDTIITRRKEHVYEQRHRDFQSWRRGRYVEFNLVYDRGTLFGLQWGGRSESILISLPPQVAWHYDYQPEPGSPEATLLDDFLQPRDWLDLG